MQKQYLLAAAVLATLVSATSASFAFYKLSLTWPTSFCNNNPSCRPSYPNYFTIHGLWPTNSDDTSVPAYSPTNRCVNVVPTPQDQIEPLLAPIRNRLDRMWPTFIANNDNIVFWRHEWRRHGKCSDYPQAPRSYFEAALNLAENNRYNPLRVMGISPGDQTNTTVILNNVYNQFRAYPELYCTRNGNVNQLVEIRFCFDRARPPSTIRSCPARFDFTGSCTSWGVSVTLPRHPSNNINIRQVV